MSLYIFDKDGTLLKKRPLYKGLVRAPLKPKEQVLRKGVYKKLAELRAEGHKLGMASNMVTVAQGRTTMKEAARLMTDAADKVGGVDAMRFCPYTPKSPKKLHGKKNPYHRDDECRKPHPGMILELMKALGYGPKDTIMVGDSRADRKAAKRVGAKHISAKKFFKPKKGK